MLSGISTYTEEKFFNYGENGEFETQNVEEFKHLSFYVVFSTDLPETSSYISGKITFLASNDGEFWKDIGCVGCHNYMSPIAKTFVVGENPFSYIKPVFKFLNGAGKIKIIGKYRKK